MTDNIERRYMLVGKWRYILFHLLLIGIGILVGFVKIVQFTIRKPYN